jgi:hypothetical protein
MEMNHVKADDLKRNNFQCDYLLNTYNQQCWSLHMKLMSGHRSPIMHRSNPKVQVDVKYGQLKVIKAALRLSRHYVHAPMSKTGFYFWSLTTTKRIIKVATIWLGHRCPAVRFIWPLPTPWNCEGPRDPSEGRSMENCNWILWGHMPSTLVWNNLTRFWMKW